MSPEKLTYMANQIGKSFAHQGEECAIAGVADHIRKFWDPRMRSALREYVQAGGTGLDPWVRSGVLRAGSAEKKGSG